MAVALLGEEFDQRHFAENLVFAEGLEQAISCPDLNLAALNDVKLRSRIAFRENRLACRVIVGWNFWTEEEAEIVNVVRHVLFFPRIRCDALPFIRVIA